MSNMSAITCIKIIDLQNYFKATLDQFLTYFIEIFFLYIIYYVIFIDQTDTVYIYFV